MGNAEEPLGVCDARDRAEGMTVPPDEPWEPAGPMDPKDLPPGFYFPPGSEPGRQKASTSGPVWVLVAIVVLVALAGVVGVLWLL